MTLKFEFQINRAKKEAFKDYLLLLEHLGEAPKKDLIILIDGCESLEALKETRNIFQNRM